MKSNIFLAVLLVIVLTSVSSFSGYYILASANQKKTFNVTRVIDGDTIELASGERIRLLGINAPDKGEVYYEESKIKLSELVESKKIRLETGSEDKDFYGRSLRYVFVNSTFVNLQLVKIGYANVYILDPDEKYYLEFKTAEKDAKERKLGIWNTSTLNGCIVIVDFHYDAAGNDDNNLNDEYVTLENVCKNTINMRDWIARDAGRTKYVFGKFIVQPNASFSLFSGDGLNTGDKLYWSSKRAVWKNEGDTLFLWDKNGNLILSYSYP